MDKQTLKALEFEKILDMVSSFATTSEGRERVLSITPFKDHDSLIKRFRAVSECRRLLQESKSTGIEPMEPLRPLIEKLRPHDAVLEGLELRAFLALFSSAESLKRLLPDIKEDVLRDLISRIHTLPHLKKQVERSIDSDGTIKDEASPELYNIRERIKKVGRKIKSILEDILDTPHLIPHIQDFYITERNGRWVIPVKNDSKGHIPGVIHDISNTGETVFVEPREAVQFGNELESLRAEEKLEEFRVLKELSSLLRNAIDEIEVDHDVILEMDMLQSLAKAGEFMGAEIPEINRKGIIDIKKGKHPLLWRSLKRSGRENELVPLDFTLGKDYTCLVITGPNAGGKTVVLKTVGVLVLMALCGIPVPASSGTTLPFLKSIFADIGDEQSIEANISTFSGHVLRIREILQKARRSSLVIIDELGTGTDPDEGGALGCSVLRRLREGEVLTVVSTHLGLIKAFAHSEHSLENGSMLMEQIEEKGHIHYKPTYKLHVGIAGQSHALEIAKRLGMPEDIIEQAKSLLGDKERFFEEILTSLNEKRRLLDRELEDIRSLKRDLEYLKVRLKEEIERIKLEKREIIKEMATKADTFYRKAIAEAEALLKRLQKQKDREQAKATVKDMIRKKEEIKKLVTPIEPLKKQLKNIEIGAIAHIGSLNKEGVIKTINPSTGRCRVVVMGKEIDIPINDLFEPEGVKDAKTSDKPPMVDRENIDTLTPLELNLLGVHVDDALSLLERKLNDASISGVSAIRIIHGIGTGALSRAIREYLKEHPLVTGFRPGSKEEGGEGVTVVTL